MAADTIHVLYLEALFKTINSKTQHVDYLGIQPSLGSYIIYSYLYIYFIYPHDVPIVKTHDV